MVVSAMATTLFLGGGQWPWPLSFLNANGWLQFVAFLVKKKRRQAPTAEPYTVPTTGATVAGVSEAS